MEKMVKIIMIANINKFNKLKMRIYLRVFTYLSIDFIVFNYTGTDGVGGD